MTDAALIAQFQAGHIAAFNTLVERWECPIYNFVLRYAGDRDDARDLCQQTFIRAYKSLRRLRDPDKFTAWIYQIALNACRDAARSRKFISLDALWESTPIADAKARTDARAHEQSVRDLIHRALQNLPEEQRVVIVMKEYQGLKFTEIAETLNVPINTVKSRMYYGLSALKKIFDRWHISEDMARYEL